MRTVDPVRHQEKRQDILQAAKRCFAREGLRGASMSSICAEAGVSPGHLYHYFESKDAILRAITDIVLQDVSEEFGRNLESSDALAALMSQAMRDKVNEEASGRVLVLDMLADAGRDSGLATILQEHSARMQAMLAEVLRKGQARQRIDPGLDPQTAAAVLIALVDGSKTMGVRHPGLDWDRAIDQLRTLIVRFLTPPDERLTPNPSL